MICVNRQASFFFFQAEDGIRDLTVTGVQTCALPISLGPPVCPPVNLHAHLDSPNINMISCGAQATVPIVHAVSSVVPVPYAEIVASVASRSAGPGTRANIDERSEEHTSELQSQSNL